MDLLANPINEDRLAPAARGALAAAPRDAMGHAVFRTMCGTSFGMPPSAWIAALRIDRAKRLLKTGTLPLQQVADACGYADMSHFSHRFRAATGVPPGQWRSAVGG